MNRPKRNHPPLIAIALTLLMGLVVSLVFLGLLFLFGCRTRPMTAEEQQGEARKLGERMYEDTHPAKRDPDRAGLALPSRQSQSFLTDRAGLAMSPTKQWRVEWDYAGPGPVWFEVWHASGLENFSWTGGTNVPRGFALFATTGKTNAAVASVPIAAQERAEFFIVRAVNEFGASDWANTSNKQNP